jgi:hypothetical protein
MRKRQLVVLVVAAALAIAASAMAQQGSMGERSSSQEVFAGAIGKFVSVLADDGGPYALPAFPATIFHFVSVPLKYKSNKFFLTVATSSQVNCDANSTGSAVLVGGFFAFPDPTGAFWFDCDDLFDFDSDGFQTHGRNWFMLREIDGGPFIPPVVSPVELHHTSLFGGGLLNTITIIARREK